MTNGDLIHELSSGGYLRSPLLVAAFQTADRAAFVPPEYKTEAYGNYPLPLGHGQTISQPLTVAFMLELLEPKAGEKVLDVGCGSGWQTALLAVAVGENGHVVAIERIPELAALARTNLAPFGFIEKGSVKVLEGDGSLGCPAEAPFDKIIAGASAKEIPDAWKAETKVGGRIVAPVGETVVVLDKVGAEEWKERRYPGFVFVPLVAG